MSSLEFVVDFFVVSVGILSKGLQTLFLFFPNQFNVALAELDGLLGLTSIGGYLYIGVCAMSK